MKINKPIAKMTPAEKAELKARMLARGLDDSDVFPGALGNKHHVTPNKPLHRRRSAKVAV